jgi:hypothetical protein
MDEVGWHLLFLRELYADVSGLLRDASGIRKRRGRGNPHPSAADMNEDEKVHVHKPAECPNLL